MIRQDNISFMIIFLILNSFLLDNVLNSQDYSHERKSLRLLPFLVTNWSNVQKRFYRSAIFFCLCPFLAIKKLSETVNSLILLKWYKNHNWTGKQSRYLCSTCSCFALLTIHTLTSVCIFSKPFSVYFPRRRQEEFLLTIKISFRWWSFKSKG